MLDLRLKKVNNMNIHGLYVEGTDNASLESLADAFNKAVKSTEQKLYMYAAYTDTEEGEFYYGVFTDEELTAQADIEIIEREAERIYKLG